MKINISQYEKKWEDVLQVVKRKTNPQIYFTWFFGVKYIDFRNNELLLEVPNIFIKIWLKKNYYNLIKNIVIEQFELEEDILIKFNTMPVPEHSLGKGKKEKKKYISPKKYQETGLNPEHTFDNFILGDNNRSAYEASLAVAFSPGKCYNPLFIHGGESRDREHLIHAIGNYVFLKNPNVDIACTSAKIFYYELINSIRNDKYQVFKEKYRNLDFLILSDIQFLAFKEKEQEEFFLTFNPLYKSGKQIIITSSCHPEDLIYFETRLISRFKEGLIVNIQEPDFETRVAILQKKAEEIQLKLSYEIIYYIAYIIPANTDITKIEEVITKLNTYINLNNQKEVDFAMVRQIVKDIKPIEEKKISIEMIQKYTAEYFGLKPDVLLSRKSAGNIATARNIAMYLARRMTRYSPTDIGKSFGRKDSNIVLHSYDKIKEQADKERKLRIIIGTLIIKLKCSLIQ